MMGPIPHDDDCLSLVDPLNRCTCGADGTNAELDRIGRQFEKEIDEILSSPGYRLVVRYERIPEEESPSRDECAFNYCPTR